MIASFKKDKLQHYLATLKFSLYCITHPLDGFWDLTHEKRGSYAAANTILIVTLIVRLMKLKFTSFLFLNVYWEELNILLYLASVVFPLMIFVLGNWALTTLFDGKGRLGQVYMTTCYCLVPYSLIQIPLMVLSNIVTADEAEFYSLLSTLSLVWCAFLFIEAMGQIHEYSPGKNIVFMVFSLFAMLVIIFIIMLFFSMITQGVAYFISTGKELMFRL